VPKHESILGLDRGHQFAISPCGEQYTTHTKVVGKSPSIHQFIDFPTDFLVSIGREVDTIKVNMTENGGCFSLGEVTENAES
jgi:hypothetical protein